MMHFDRAFQFLDLGSYLHALSFLAGTEYPHFVAVLDVLNFSDLSQPVNEAFGASGLLHVNREH
jgi:hypothetical protein